MNRSRTRRRRPAGWLMPLLVLLAVASAAVLVALLELMAR